LGILQDFTDCQPVAPTQHQNVSRSGNRRESGMNESLMIPVLVTRAELQMAIQEKTDVILETSQNNMLIAGIAGQDDLVSVQFDIGSYYQGAAHPNSHTETINYDLKNGKQLKLADVFKPGSKYLQTLSAYCIADLKKQSKEKNAELLEDMLNEGAAPTAKNYESWTITKRGIGINFDSYQVAPYAAGPQFVMVPYSALKDLIKPDGPIAGFAI